jgi:O-6-methylguanine DNA methyltransferase
MEWLNGRLRRVDLGADSSRDRNDGGVRYEHFFEWLVAFEVADATKKWEFLAPRGTDFQRRVWKALLGVEWGRCTSYGALAAAIGQAKAARAVASAVASNPVALWIPCHRVIRGDGQLGGFRWGRAMKATLLEIETSRGNWRTVFSQDSTT